MASECAQSTGRDRQPCGAGREVFTHRPAEDRRRCSAAQPSTSVFRAEQSFAFVVRLAEGRKLGCESQREAILLQKASAARRHRPPTDAERDAEPAPSPGLTEELQPLSWTARVGRQPGLGAPGRRAARGFRHPASLDADWRRRGRPVAR